MRGIFFEKARRLLAALMAGGLLVLLASCGGEPEGIQFQEGKEFSIAVTEEPDSFNPLLAEGELAQELFLLVYDPLWRIGPDGEPVNCLVEDYSLSSDQLTWTIRLRTDVTFSDGSPLTSADVQYTYNTMAIHSPVYGPYCEGVADIRCPDERTVVITTSYVKGDMMYCPVPILPRSVWSAQSNPETFDNEQMIGSGPFVRVLEDRGPQEISWIFQARSDYFGGAAHIGGLRFVYYATETGAARALSTGGVDAAIGMTDVQLVTLEGVPGVQLIQGLLPCSDIWALAFNTRSGVFASATMRQMVEYCLDRALVLSMSNGDAGMTGSVFASPATDYFYNLPNMRPIDYNTAKNILYTAGYEDIDSDGILEYLVTRDDLTLKLYTSEQDDWASTAATVLKGNLEEIGVRLSWETVEGDVRDVCTPKGNWDMCLVGWRGNVNPVLAANQVRPDSSGLTGWQNPSFDEALQRLRTATDQASVNTYAGQLQQITYDDCAYIFLAYRSDIMAIRSDRWTGYKDVLETSGGVFCTGCVDAYLSITPAEGA